MIELGNRAERGASSSITLGVVSVVLMLAMFASVAIVSSYSGARSRSAARVPIAASNAQETTFQWLSEPFQIGTYGGWKFSVRSMSPDSPPPPGLDRWPDPGESYISPQLKSLLDSGKTPYTYLGRVVGLIDTPGLTNSGEIIAYTNPPVVNLSPDPEGFLPASGFGQADPGWGSTVNDMPVAVFLVMYTILLLIPAGGLFTAGLLVGNGPRSRRLRQLELLGASRMQLMQWQFTRRIAWVIAGAIIAFGALVFAMHYGVTVPGTAIGGGFDYRLEPSDLQGHWAWFTVVGIATAAVAIVLAVRVHPQVEARPDSMRHTPRRTKWAAFACAGLLTLSLPIAMAPELIPSENAALRHTLGEFQSWWAMGALVAIAFTLPSLVDVACGWAVHRLRRGSAASLLGAGLLSRSRHHAVIIAGAVGVILAVLAFASTQVQIYAGASVNAVDALAEATPTVVATHRSGAKPIDHELVDELRSHDLDVLGLQSDDATFATTLFGSSPLLTVTRTGSDCIVRSQQAALATMLEVYGVQGCPRPWKEFIASSEGSALVVTDPRGPIDIDSVATLLARNGAPALKLFPVVDGGNGGFSETRAVWIRTFGLTGVALAVLALSVLSAADIRQASRNVSRYVILGASSRTVIAAMAWRVLTPVLFAVAAASVYATQVFRIVTETAKEVGVRLRSDDTTYFAVSVIALVTVGWVMASIDTLRMARRWKSGGSRE